MTATPSLAALGSRADLLAYGQDKALLLFALQLQFNIDDIDSVAAVALTDQSNDKKCDLVFCDRQTGVAVVAQGYYSQDETKSQAPANKASDLNTAVTWLLKGAVEALPETLRSAALEVRDALLQDQISDVYIWYCHNLPESDNVETELRQVVTTADSLLRTHYPKATLPSIVANEVGRNRLEELYRRTESPIVVTEEYEVDVPGGFEIRGGSWKAFCTSVSGQWLRALWDTHKADLMSPNVREYLGIVRSERNINNGIKMTARQLPERFWIYNNGLTVLVNEYELKREDGAQRLRIKGIGIINGAQTTGAVGTLSDADATSLADVQVMTRFVACSDAEVLGEIVKYNNTQNKVEATDFRSKDPVQERLRKEFASVPDADYRGGRRGGIRDAIERSKNLLPDGTVAQALAAFHGRPNLAYNETRRIWDEDGVYASIFSDKTTVSHIVFTFSLLRAIEELKRDISLIPEERRTASQHKHAAFLRQRGSIPLLVSAIADSLETVVGAVISDRWALRFADNCSPRAGALRWQPLVNVCLPFVNQLTTAADNDLKNSDRVRDAISRFSSMIESTVESNSGLYKNFSVRVKIS